MDALRPLVLAADEVETMRAAGVLSFPSVAVAHDQDGTILLIERWAGLPADEPEAAG
jgi:quinol monooxygenase YgiN